MSLALKLDSLEGLDESVKNLYKEENGSFMLDVTGLPEVPKDYNDLKLSMEKLEANNKELLGEKIEAKKLADKAKSDAEAAALEAAKKGGDIDAVEKSWIEKYKKLEDESKQSNNNSQVMINELTVGAASKTIASAIALPGSASVLEPHIKNRLTVEIKDNMPTIRVLDKNGQPSAMTLDELSAEFKADPSFAPIIVGSRASGGGAAGGSGSASNEMNRDAFNKLSPMEQRNFLIEKNGKLVDN